MGEALRSGGLRQRPGVRTPRSAPTDEIDARQCGSATDFPMLWRPRPTPVWERDGAGPEAASGSHAWQPGVRVLSPAGVRR
ncbi:hypothetical protein KIL84_003594 [Mauremys mutica]|uniref:Uncharacterized protein n=1 Tax=Mauremys mutica TaxID=74926 RepID=A0A9D3WUG5_9SAUR|nr:hypothetical protein KIL84_003594 [Mauremys mutica]